MRVLILDDMVQRHDGFKILFAGHELHHAYTTNEARRFLEEHQFDALFLDHDLNEYIPGMYGSTEVTGYDFCRWLVPTALGTSVDERIPITTTYVICTGCRRTPSLSCVPARSSGEVRCCLAPGPPNTSGRRAGAA